ncbi:DUF1275 domain-containing protein, partial [Francisella tularensis subsp. holarctica]|nr:DUF1275 domain-containing protein [Francisella tularensis subsp. holarctica]
MSCWFDSLVLFISFVGSVAVMSWNLRILCHSIACSDCFFLSKVVILIAWLVVVDAINGVII